MVEIEANGTSQEELHVEAWGADKGEMFYHYRVRDLGQTDAKSLTRSS